MIRLLRAHPEAYDALDQFPSAMTKAVSYICSSLLGHNALESTSQPLHVYLRPTHALLGCCHNVDDFHESLHASTSDKPVTIALHGMITKLSEAQTTVHAHVHACSACKYVPKLVVPVRLLSCTRNMLCCQCDLVM
jgi:hypothetical protein